LVEFRPFPPGRRELDMKWKSFKVGSLIKAAAFKVPEQNPRMVQSGLWL
jgi:hypothetical protein